MPQLSLSLADRSYDILIDHGLLHKLGDLLIARKLAPSRAIALITDSTVAPLYASIATQALEKAGYRVSLHVFPAGEAHKHLATVEQLSCEMVAAGHDRQSLIVALGGGVVGDLAGFLASIYYRGIPFVQVPTTIMAQVDSSVGGKTAVDIACGKNLVGAFHQPQLVVIDPSTLRSLPPRVFREGMAEMVKHAAIRDAAMLPALHQVGQEVETGLRPETWEKLPELLAANIAIKARIVEADEEERLGIRALLNFGHTLGHGIEASLPYGELLHGEALSLGMRAALFLSRRHAGLDEALERELLDCLAALDLPLVLPSHIDPEIALQMTASDKKFEAGSIRFVLLSRAGEAAVSHAVTQEDLRDALAELQRPYPPTC